MHKFVLGTPPKQQVIDHINGDKLDNRKCNLRFATRSQNNQNKVVKQNKTSKYIGVHFDTKTNKYTAYCKGIHFGRFDDEVSAGMAHDKAALILFGPDAKTNGLCTLSDIKGLTIEDPKKERNKQLPNNVYFEAERNKYFVEVRYKKRRWKKFGFASVDEALIKRKEFYKEIDELKKKEEEEFISQPITRNDEGVAMIQIQTKQVLVDDHVWHDLMRYRWSLTNGYACGETDGKPTRMHRYLLNASDDVEVVDHIDRNPLNNRLCNLRPATYGQNSQNKTNSYENKLSKYIGVTLDKRNADKTRKWVAKISYQGKSTHVGIFATEDEAGVAYNIRARELYGEHAMVNAIYHEEDIAIRVKAYLSAPICVPHTTKYVGIGVADGKYRVRLIVDKKEMGFGYYDDIQDALVAYNIAVKHYYKDKKKTHSLDISKEDYDKRETAVRNKLVEMNRLD